VGITAQLTEARTGEVPQKILASLDDQLNAHQPFAQIRHQPFAATVPSTSLQAFGFRRACNWRSSDCLSASPDRRPPLGTSFLPRWRCP
jgi:hypothetical protein